MKINKFPIKANYKSYFPPFGIPVALDSWHKFFYVFDGSKVSRLYYATPDSMIYKKFKRDYGFYSCNGHVLKKSCKDIFDKCYPSLKDEHYRRIEFQVKCICDRNGYLSAADFYDLYADVVRTTLFYKARDKYLNSQIYDNSLKSIERFIGKIEKPIFLNYQDNSQKHFDEIQIWVHTTTWENKKQFMNEHQRQIMQVILDKLSKDKRFLKYGVPIGCLALTSIYEQYDSTYVFSFELKKELKEILNQKKEDQNGTNNWNHGGEWSWQNNITP